MGKHEPDIGQFTTLIVPIQVGSTIEQICSRLNNDLNPRTWYVQYHGDRIRHLRSDERPLFIQHDYLLSIGYSSVQRLQQEGDKHDLGYLIRFLSGKTNDCFVCLLRKGFSFLRSIDN